MGSTVQSTCLHSERKMGENVSMVIQSEGFGWLFTEHMVQKDYLPS